MRLGNVYARYRQRRRGFYMFLDRLGKGVSVVAGCGSRRLIRTVNPHPSIGQRLILGGALAVALLNAWDWWSVSQTGQGCMRIFGKNNQSELTKRRPFGAIYAQCWNQVVIAANLPTERLRHLPLWKLYTGYVVRCMSIRFRQNRFRRPSTSAHCSSLILA
jgi:hypothetical protein